jgi:hypothetical protein
LVWAAGSIAASSLSNAYYPEKNRGVGATFSRVAMSIPFNLIDQLVDQPNYLLPSLLPISTMKPEGCC